MTPRLALLLAGPIALETPVRSPGVAAAVHVLGVMAAVVAAVAVFFGLCAIAACLLSSRISERERRAIRRRPITVEPDPLESYPGQQNPEKRGPDVRVWVHRENQMPLPFNPVGRSDATMRIRE